MNAAAPRTLFFELDGPVPRAGALGYFLALPTGPSWPLRRHDAFGQHLPDAAEGLAGAFFVLEERRADVAIAVAAEADAGRGRIPAQR